MTDAPAGTSAWRRLLAAISRPLRENRDRMRSATASSRTSSAPITAARASRVMSSGVGPSPPQTITASLRSRASSRAPTSRPWLSPTLVWWKLSIPTAASCSPIQAELVSTTCPSSSSVPTATTSQFTGTRPCPPPLRSSPARLPRRAGRDRRHFAVHRRAPPPTAAASQFTRASFRWGRPPSGRRAGTGRR